MRFTFSASVLIVSCSLVSAQEPQAPNTQAATVASHAAPAGPSEKPRVFITDSQSWEVSGSAGGANGAFAAQSHGGARPQTAEIIKTFGERCPNVIVNNKQDLADFIVVLDHEGGKGVLRHRNKVAVFEHVSGDVVVSHSTLSLGGSVEDACDGITHYWSAHGQEILAGKQKTRSAGVPVATPAASVALQLPTPSQASVTVESTPSGADIEVDGEFVGNTPSTISVAAGTHQISVKKKGYSDWSRKMNVSGGNIHLNAQFEQTP
jgi:hypothetical protein